MKNEKFFEIFIKISLAIFENMIYNVINRRKAEQSTVGKGKGEGRRRMTLTELAKLAYVSTSTASKAFSMSTEVSEQTRNMIFDIAKKHGCFKKFYRAEYPDCVIALICPEFDSSYYSELISAFQERLAFHNSELTVAETGFSSKNAEKLVKYYDKYQTVDGIILINTSTPKAHNGAIPIVTVGRLSGNTGDIDIKIDNSTPLYDAIRHFKDMGISQIGFIGDSFTGSRERIFRSAYKEILGSESVPAVVKSSKRFEIGGYAALKKMIKEKTLPRAIICAYDRIAFGVMRAAAEEGLKIPEDIMLVGFDDAAISAYHTPSLSSINPSIKETARAACDNIIAKIRGEEFSASVNINCPLILRESSMKK